MRVAKKVHKFKIYHTFSKFLFPLVHFLAIFFFLLCYGTTTSDYLRNLNAIYASILCRHYLYIGRCNASFSTQPPDKTFHFQCYFNAFFCVGKLTSSLFFYSYM